MYKYIIHPNNFGDGHINAYDSHIGTFLGTLNDENNLPIVMPGLWSLKFEHHAHDRGDSEQVKLYFTSSPNGETDGLVGAIVHDKD